MDCNEGDQSKVIKPETDQHYHTPSSDYAPYPRIGPDDVAPTETCSFAPMVSQPPSAPPYVKYPVSPALKSAHPTPDVGNSATTMPLESNPYVSSSVVPSSPSKNKVESVKAMFGKFGKKAAETTKKVEGLAGDMWQHLKTNPSFADAAMGRIAQSTKALAEGGYEKIFQHTFEMLPEERFLKSYPCYLSTSSGPVMGVLYLSTKKLAFCSDNPLSYKDGETTLWSYYKVVIPLAEVKEAKPSTSKIKAGEKFLQVVSMEGHEFWFLGFVNYEGAVKNLGQLIPCGV